MEIKDSFRSSPARFLESGFEQHYVKTESTEEKSVCAGRLACLETARAAAAAAAASLNH